MESNKLFKAKRSVISMFTALLCAFALTGCIESDPPMIQVSKKSVNAGCEAQSISVTVTSNVEWTAESNSEWLQLSRTKGSNTEELDLVIDACDATQSRMAIVTLKTIGKNVSQTTVTVSQSAKNTVLLLAPANVTAGAKAQDVSFAVAANGEWTVTSSSSWATPKVTSGSGNAVVTVALAENSSHSEDRTAKIEVSSGNETERAQAEFSITQLSRETATLFVTNGTLHFTADAKTAGTNVAVVPVITNITGAVEVTSEFSWCDAVYADGAVTITVQDNTDNAERSCVVNVYAAIDGAMVLRQITVSQSGIGSPVLYMLKSSVVVPAFSGDQANKVQAVSAGYIPATSGITVSAVNDYPSWITDVAVDAENNLLKFNVQASEETEPRSAVVTLLAKLGSETATYPVAVTQQGIGECKVAISAPSVAFTAEGGKTTVEAFTNQAQAVATAYSANASWVKAVATSTANSFGVSSAVEIVCDPNQAAGSRTAEVIVAVSAGSQTVYGVIEVVQAGIGSPEVTATETNINFPNAGGSYVIALAGDDASTTVEAVVPVDWIEYKIEEGSAEFTAKENTSSSAPRECTVTLVIKKGGETQIIPVNIKQAGTGSAELIIAKSEYAFPQTGGVFHIEIASGNGTEFEVIGTPDWITTQEVDDPAGIKVVVVTNPDADGRNGNITILAHNGDDYTYYIIAVTQYGLEAPDIALGQTEIVIPRTVTDGTEGYAVVVAGADASTKVKATADQPWLKPIVDASKKSIAVAAEENKTSVKREANISVVAERGGIEQILSFKVVQPGTGSAELRLPVTSYAFGPAEVKAFNIPVTAINGSAYTVASHPEWITVTGAGTSMLTLAVESNENTTEARSGVIVLQATNGSDAIQYSIAVSQTGANGPNVTNAVSSITVPREAIAGTEGYNVALIGVDAATALTTASTAAWVKGVITADGSLSFITEENTKSDSREAVVSVIATRAGEEQIISVKVVQPGTGSAELRLVLNDYSFSYKEVKDFVIPVTMIRGTKYTVSAKPEWLTFTGEGTDSLKISIPENIVTELRAGSIVLRATNGDNETVYTIGVTQLGIDGPDLVAEYHDVVIKSLASDTQFVEITGIDAYTNVSIYSSQSWLTAKFNDFKTWLYLIAEENMLSDKREAVITLKAEKGGQFQTVVIRVTQPGKGSAEIEIPHDKYTFTYKGATSFAIPVNAIKTTTWTVTSQDNAAWLHLFDEGTEAFNVTVDANPLVDQRSETLVFRASNGDDQTLYTVEIIQTGVDGPAVAALQSSIVLQKEASADKFIAFDGVDAATAVSVSENAEWLTVSYDGTTKKVTFTVTENKANASRTTEVAVTAVKGGQTQIFYLTVTQLGYGSPSVSCIFDEYFVPAVPLTSYIGYISFRTNNTAEVKIVKSSVPAWINITYEDSDNYESAGYFDLKFKVAKNESTESRSFDLILKATSGSETIFFTQKITQYGGQAPSVQALNPFVTRSYEAGSYNDYIINGVLNKASSEAVAGTPVVSAEWITNVIVIDWRYGYVDYDLSENTSKEARTGTITVPFTLNGETVILQIAITQLGNGGASVNLSDDQFSFGSAAFTAFPVGCVPSEGATVTASTQTAWITNVAYAAGKITFDVAENTAADQRAGYITVVAAKGDEQAVYNIAVLQAGTAGPDVTALQTELYLPSQAVTTKDNKVDLAGVDADTEIAVTDNADWLTATYDATGKFVYVTTETNNTDAARVANVSITATKGGQMQFFTVKVTQAATSKYSYLLSPSTIYFDKNGGTKLFTADYMNIAYLAIESPDPMAGWLTFTLPAGYDDGAHTYEISAAAIGAAAARNQDIVIRYGASDTDYKTATLKVSQSDATGFYFAPGGDLILLPAYITSAGPMPGRSGKAPAAPANYKSFISVVESPATFKPQNIKSDVDWISTAANSDPDGILINGLADNIGKYQRVGMVSFDDGTNPEQINVVQLAKTDPQIISYATPNEMFDAKIRTIYLSNARDAVASVTFKCANVTTATPVVDETYAGYEAKAANYTVETVFDGSNVTLKITNLAASTAAVKGVIKLTVSDGTNREVYTLLFEQDAPGAYYYGTANSVLPVSGVATVNVARHMASATFTPVAASVPKGAPTAAKAKLIWKETAGNLEMTIGDIADDSFQVTGITGTGNALVGIYDANDNLLWSYHIWVPADDPTATLTYSNNVKVMPMALGATKIVNYFLNGATGFGLYYQWGRKDPLGRLIGNGTFAAAIDENGNSYALPKALTQATPVDRAWSDNKTIYDPCPSGYKVPKGSVFSVLKKSNADEFNRGYNFYLAEGKTGGTDFYPAEGFYKNTDGLVYSFGIEGYYWLNSEYDSTNAYLFQFTKDIVGTDWYWYKDYGLPIRCVAE